MDKRRRSLALAVVAGVGLWAILVFGGEQEAWAQKKPSAPVINSLGCSPTTVQVGQVLSCSPSVSGTTAGSAFRWTGTDVAGEIAGSTFAKRYNTPGTKTINLRVCNDSLCNSASATITTGAPAAPPVAKAPKIDQVQPTADGYMLAGSGFGTDRAKVKVFEGDKDVSGSVTHVADGVIAVRSQPAGAVPHRVMVAGQASNVLSFPHPSKPTITGVERTADGYMITGSGFGKDKAKVQVFEGNTQVAPNLVTYVADNVISVQGSRPAGAIQHKVMVTGQASNVFSFTHPVTIVAPQPLPTAKVAPVPAAPTIARVERTTDGYRILGSGFGTDRSKVQVFEGATRVADASVREPVKNDEISVRSRPTGTVQHKVVVAGQVSNVVSFGHPAVAVAREPAPTPAAPAPPPPPPPPPAPGLGQRQDALRAQQAPPSGPVDADTADEAAATAERAGATFRAAAAAARNRGDDVAAGAFETAASAAVLVAQAWRDAAARARAAAVIESVSPESANNLAAFELTIRVRGLSARDLQRASVGLRPPPGGATGTAVWQELPNAPGCERATGCLRARVALSAAGVASPGQWEVVVFRPRAGELTHPFHVEAAVGATRAPGVRSITPPAGVQGQLEVPVTIRGSDLADEHGRRPSIRIEPPRGTTFRSNEEMITWGFGPQDPNCVLPDCLMIELRIGPRARADRWGIYVSNSFGESPFHAFDVRAAAGGTGAGTLFAALMPAFSNVRCTNCHGGVNAATGANHPGGRQANPTNPATCGGSGCHSSARGYVDPEDGGRLVEERPGWRQPDASFRFAGTARDICRTVLSHGTAAAAASHVQADPLVRWSFRPGAGSAVSGVPFAGGHSAFVTRMRQWAAAGANAPGTTPEEKWCR